MTLWCGQRACRSRRQPYARKHVANHQRQPANRQAAGSGLSNSETRGWRFSHLRELPGRPFALLRCPVPGQASNIDRGIRLRADLAACKG